MVHSIKLPAYWIFGLHLWKMLNISNIFMRYSTCVKKHKDASRPFQTSRPFLNYKMTWPSQSYFSLREFRGFFCPLTYKILLQVKLFTQNVKENFPWTIQATLLWLLRIFQVSCLFSRSGNICCLFTAWSFSPCIVCYTHPTKNSFLIHIKL